MNRYALFSILLHGTFCLFLLLVPHQKRRLPFNPTYSVSLKPAPPKVIKKKAARTKKSSIAKKKKAAKTKKKRSKAVPQEEIMPDIETPESDYIPEPMLETPEHNMSISKNTDTFNHPDYFNQIRSVINHHWATASWNIGRDRKLLTTVSFRIDKMGMVTKIRVEKSSGLELYDTASIKAIQNSSPLPPLPEDYKESHIDIFFDFAYERK